MGNEPALRHCCQGDRGCSSNPPEELGAPASTRSGEVLWRIASMDCASEESEIPEALEAVAGIGELRFQLASRTLAIRADAAVLGNAETILRPPKPSRPCCRPSGCMGRSTSLWP